MTDGELKIHSDMAWNIANQWSWTLASDTRTLAAQIDFALSEARATGRREGLSEAAKIAEWSAKTFNFQQALVDWDDMLVGGQSARLEIAAAIRAAMEKAE